MSNPFFGINAHLASRFGGAPGGPVALIQQTGALWVREEIRWDMVRNFGRAPTDEAGWSFALVDPAIDAEFAADLRILGLLGYNVAQFQQFGRPDWHMPDLTEWTRYVDRTVRHFKGRISAWQVWNEPNNQPMFWMDATGPDDPSQVPQRIDNYIALLQATFDTIRNADDTVEVVSAGCADIDPAEWLDIFSARGGMECCDVVGVHPYIPRDRLTSGDFRTRDLPHLRAFQRRVGKALWFTEVGWSSAVGRPGVEEDGDCVGSEAAQADFLERQYTEILASGIQLGPIFWYDLHEDPVNPGDPNDDIDGREHHFGLLRLNPRDPNDWTQTKPAYTRYTQLANS